MKKFIIIILLVQFGGKSFSQSSHPDSVKLELNKINRYYDSASFLAFDVSVLLTSDTLLGYFEYEHQAGKYMLNRNNIFYQIGTTEYMQDDSFAVTTYNDEHLIYLSGRTVKNSSALFPVKQLTDSAFQMFLSYYTLSVDDSAAERRIHFRTDSTSVLYKTIDINYYSTGSIASLGFSFKDFADQKENDSAGVVLPVLTKRLTMKFDNYHFLNTGDVFRYSNYVYYDRERHEYVGTGRYKGYRVITSNLANTALNFNDVEVPAEEVITN